jgi:hypothetical protein
MTASLRLAALALCAMPIAAFAAPPIPLPWHAGTTLEYMSTRIEERQSGTTHRTTTSRSHTTIEIVEAREDGFVQVWRDHDSTLVMQGNDPALEDQRAIAQKLQDAFKDAVVEVDLDGTGLFVGVRNWQALATTLRATMGPILRGQARAQPALAGLDDAELGARLGPMLDRLTTRAAIDATVGRSPQLYNLFTAPTLKPGEPVRYEGALQSPVSDHVIPAVGQFEILSVDEARDTLTVHWTQSVDPAKGAAAAWGMAHALTGVAIPADATAMPKGLEMEDEATVVIQRTSGVIVHLEHDRRLAMGEQVRTTLWTFELVPPAK